MPPRRRRRRLVLVLVQLLVCLVLLEVGLRVAETLSYRMRLLLWNPRVEIDYGEVDTVEELLETTIVGYRPFHEHSGYVLNSRGFRTPEYERSPEAGTFRVVTLGDSFTFSCSGIPTGRFWPTLLQRGLARRTGRPAEVVNLGIPATGPAFYRRMWELEASRLDPDLVIVAFFVGNDFWVHEALDPADETLGWFDRSRLLTFVHNVLAIRSAGLPPNQGGQVNRAPSPGRGGYELPDYAERYPELKPRMSRETLVHNEARRTWVCDKARRVKFEDSLQRVEEVLADLFAQLVAADVPGLVVIIPDRFQVNASERGEILQYMQRSEEDFDWERPQRRLVERLDAHAIPHLDLLPASRAAPDRRELYSPGDTHWSPKGCALAAGEILDWIERQPGQ